MNIPKTNLRPRLPAAPLCCLWIVLSLGSCGTSRHLGKSDKADYIWSFRESHPEGFTLDISTMTEPSEGISVAYYATRSSHGREMLDSVISHAAAHDGFVGGWLDRSDSLYYFDSIRLFPEDSLDAAVNFGKANFQKTIYRLSTAEEILLKEDLETVSPTNLIIMYDKEIGKEALLEAVKSCGARILYEYKIIPGIAIKMPEGSDILKAISYFSDIKGVTSVERDHIYPHPAPVRPVLLPQ